jgi:hypothetical protein
MYANDPAWKKMELHPMFPYPPAEPMHVPLVGATFWDTGVEPHRELWRIGPGDVEVLSWNTVDTFFERGDVDSEDDEYINTSRGYQGLMRKKLFGKQGYAQDMRSRNMAGEGRWGYLVIRGHRYAYGGSAAGGREETNHHRSGEEDEDGGDGDKGTAPYLMIAFPSTAVTRTTECLHICSQMAIRSQAPRRHPRLERRAGWAT